MSNLPNVIFIMGPTATGKTDLAAHLYQKIDCEIISVDSAMIYRGMDIGTAKPDKAFLQRIPHHLIDICDPAESYSAAKFREAASTLIEEILSQNKIAVLVGGTNLYFRVLEQGLAVLPGVDMTVRARLEEEGQSLGWPALHQRLQTIDPEAAARISQNDPQRIQRALEVYECSGKTLSRLLADGRQYALPHKIHKILLVPADRGSLHERIKQRYLTMLEQGLIGEVEQLYARDDLTSAHPAMRLVGYRQAWRYLDGEIDQDTMREQAIIATRQLAKRQTTWCRSETEGKWYDPFEPGIFSQIEKNLEN